MKIKVLYVHACGVRGGASTSLLHLVKSLQESGRVDPLVVCPPGSALDMFLANGVLAKAIRPLPEFFSLAGAPLAGARLLLLPRIFWSWIRANNLGSITDEFQPDIIHLNERSLVLTARDLFRREIPIVMHARNVACVQVMWAHRLGLHLMNRYVHQTIAIDESVARSLTGLKRCTVVYNPLSGNVPAVEELEQTYPSGSRGDRDTRVTILFLSNLIEYKGVWDLLEAVRLLADDDRFVLRIVGGNSRPDQFFETLVGRMCKLLGLVRKMDDEIRAYVDHFQLHKKIKLDGFVDNIDDVIKQASVNVFPSHLNGVGRSVFETGIRGIPSIISLKDRVEDIAIHGVNSLVVPEKNPQALAAAIKQLLDDPGLRARLGTNARNQFLQQFSLEESSARVFRVYQGALGRR